MTSSLTYSLAKQKQELKLSTDVVRTSTLGDRPMKSFSNQESKASSSILNRALSLCILAELNQERSKLESNIESARLANLKQEVDQLKNQKTEEETKIADIVRRIKGADLKLAAA